MKKIFKLIKEKYKKYDFIPLNYQEKIIEKGIYLFLLNFTRKIRRVPLLKTFIEEITLDFFDINLDKIEENIKKDIDFFGDERVINGVLGSGKLSYVINIDVGLGKTITSIVLSELIVEYFQFIVKKIKDLFEQEINKRINQEKDKKIIEKIIEYKKEVEERLEKEAFFQINIISRKSISTEFKQILKDKNKDSKIFYSYCYMGDLNPVNKTLSFNYNLFSLYLSFSYKALELRNIVKGNYLESYYSPLFIVDEWGTDHSFFGSADRNKRLRNEILNEYGFFIGLTANTEVRRPYFRDESLVKTPRYLKTDEEIKKELIKKQLYSGKSFIYKLFNLNSKIVEKHDKIRNSLIEEINRVNKSLEKTTEILHQDFEEILNLKKSELEEFIKNYIQIKETKKELEEYKKIREKIEENNKELKKEENINFRENFGTIFKKNNLMYLLEKNSILVLDDFFSPNDIKLLKEDLKALDFKIIGINSYNKLEGVGNILIAKKNDLIKGLNLQMYDTIIFSYIEEMSQEEIYQGIGRLDRIGIKTNKEIILFGKKINKKYLEEFLEKKEKNNGSLSLNVVDKIKSIPPSLLKELRIKKNIESNNSIQLSFEEKQREIKEELEKVKKIKKEKDKKLKNIQEIKETLFLIKENKKEFVDIIREVEEEKKKNEKLIKSLLGGSEVSLETNFLENII